MDATGTNIVRHRSIFIETVALGTGQSVTLDKRCLKLTVGTWLFTILLAIAASRSENVTHANSVYTKDAN